MKIIDRALRGMFALFVLNFACATCRAIGPDDLPPYMDFFRDPMNSMRGYPWNVGPRIPGIINAIADRYTYSVTAVPKMFGSNEVGFESYSQFTDEMRHSISARGNDRTDDMRESDILDLANACTNNLYAASYYKLLYYTEQHFISASFKEKSLGHLFGKNGKTILIAENRLWNSKKLTADMFACFEGYPPERAVVLADIVAQTSFSQLNYRLLESYYYLEEVQATDAARNLWNLYFQVRRAEVIQHSTALRLLVYNGLCDYPTTLQAQFPSNPKQPLRYMEVPPPPDWTAADVPDLQRIAESGNPYYADMALMMLTSLNLGTGSQ